MKILKVFFFLLLSAVGFAACGSDDDPNEMTVGNTPAPQWSLTNQIVEQDDPQWAVSNNDINISSSMTIILSIGVLSDDVVSTDDTMAAFIDGICVGKANVMNTEYGKRVFLFVYSPKNMTSAKVSLKYYNTTLRQVYNYDDFNTPFVNDATYGHVDDPYYFEAVATEQYSSAVGRWLSLPNYIVNNLSDDDEIAIYVGTECRLVKGTNLSVNTYDGTTYAQCLIPVKQGENNATLRYYSARLKRIFVSSEFSINADESYRIYSDAGFTEMK